MFKRVWEKWTKSKNPESPRYRYDMARRICGHHIKPATEGRFGALRLRLSSRSEVYIRNEVDHPTDGS